jgi:hypothetical protein
MIPLTIELEQKSGLTNEERLEIRKWARDLFDRNDEEKLREFGETHTYAQRWYNRIVDGAWGEPGRALTDEERHDCEVWAERLRNICPEDNWSQEGWAEILTKDMERKRKAAHKPKTVRDFEAMLRANGYSQSEAKTIISKGFHKE